MKVSRLFVMLNGLCALLCFLAFGRAQAQENKTAVSPGMSSGLQILTPTEGVDFTSYVKDLLAKVKRNWFAVMPERAQLGKKGQVVVRFHIQKDGTLLLQEPTVELSSNDAWLDKAAVSAIRSSVPFQHLPEVFSGPNIELRFMFRYNLPRESQPVPTPKEPPPTTSDTKNP